MAISLIITDARITEDEDNHNWRVMHPSNGAILAYCDTKAEAESVREAINSIPAFLKRPAPPSSYTDG